MLLNLIIYTHINSYKNQTLFPNLPTLTDDVVSVHNVLVYTPFLLQDSQTAVLLTSKGKFLIAKMCQNEC